MILSNEMENKIFCRWWMWYNLWYYASICVVNLRIVNVVARPEPGTFSNFNPTWSVK